MRKDALFNLIRNIYDGTLLSDENREYLEAIFPERSLLILADRNKYNHPTDFSPIPIETVWETLKNDTAGIFCRRVEHQDATRNLQYFLCISHLGKNIHGDEIAAGLLYSDGWSKTEKYEEEFYNLIAGLKRYYHDFSNSKAVDIFINDNSLYRYIIDPEERKTIARQVPIEDDFDANETPGRDEILNGFLKQILSKNMEPNDKPIILDDRIRDFNISKFRLHNYEYVLVSFRLSAQGINDTSEYDHVVRNFAHRIRNKVCALQTAAEQLTLQKGRILDDNDILLAEMISKASEGINLMVGRLHQFCHSNFPNTTWFDLNKAIACIIEEKRRDHDSLPHISFIPGTEIGMMSADAGQMAVALGELLDNAIAGCTEGGEIKISLQSNGDEVLIIIYNDKMPDGYGRPESSSRIEPFVSTRPDRAGIGLSITRRIINNNGGGLKISRNRDGGFEVTVNFPISLFRRVAHDVYQPA